VKDLPEFEIKVTLEKTGLLLAVVRKNIHTKGEKNLFFDLCSSVGT